MIDFNQPTLIGKELEYVAQAYDNAHVSGDGIFSKHCHAFLEKELGVSKVLLTSSCTHALEMAALLLDIQPGDEVILPSFTFVSTVNAFVLRGARPVFADIRPDTLNLDETRLGELLSPHTKAIVPVHYAGVGCEMEQILQIASYANVAVVEDNAHGLFGKYRGKNLGSFGVLASQSFHESKNFSCGEGGALLINDPALIERAEILREKGTNRSRFFRGMVDKYTWVDIGSSYLLSDILAALLWAQFENYQSVQEKRKSLWQTYTAGLTEWAKANDVQLPFVPEHCDQAYHMFYLILPSLEIRQKVISELKQRDIIAVFHYLPLHLSDMGRKFGGQTGDCPITERVSDTLLRLPFHNSLTHTDQLKVIEALQSIRF